MTVPHCYISVVYCGAKGWAEASLTLGEFARNRRLFEQLEIVYFTLEGALS